MSDFFNVLFDKGDSICIGDSVFCTDVFPLSDLPNGCFFSINPLKERRKDANVTCFRNFLVEFDAIPLVEQLNIVESLRMPFSTCVFSGGQSFHFIIALATPLATRAEYDCMARRICRAVRQADPSAKNPSRLSRVPNAMRPDNGQTQTLVHVKQRVPNDEVERWLASHQVFPEAPQQQKVRLKMKNPAGLSMATQNFLYLGAKPGRRTSTLFAAACDMHRNGFNQEEIIKLAGNVLDFSEDPDWYRTVRCAIEAVGLIS